MDVGHLGIRDDDAALAKQVATVMDRSDSEVVLSDHSTDRSLTLPLESI